MDHHLVVKFPWSLRPKPIDIQLNEEKTLSRNTLYVRKLKKEKRQKYESILEKDRIRAKEKYVKITDKSETEKQKARLKWAQQKSNQRKRKKNSEQGTSSEGQPPRKKIKEMSMEEKKKNMRDKKKKRKKKTA